MKKILLALSLCITLGFVPETEINLPKNAKKKVLKSFDMLWPEETIRVDLFSDDQMDGAIAKQLKRLQLYVISTKEERVGYLFLSAAPSRYNDFDLMVIYDTEMAIIDTKVLTYREDWGGEIGSKRWLKQFLNKKADDQIQLGRDIQGISGATISVRSATVAIKLMTDKLALLQSQGLLN